MIKACRSCKDNYTPKVKYQQICESCNKLTPQQRYRINNIELCRKRTRENQRHLNNKNRFGGNRIKVLERDDYTCQKCDVDVSEKYKAQIHHKDRNRENNSLSNLETLCKKCHCIHHYKKDIKLNKLGQFISY